MILQTLKRWRHEWKMKTSPSYAMNHQAQKYAREFFDGFNAGVEHIRNGGTFDGFTDNQLAFMKRQSSLLTFGYDEEEE